MSFDLEIKERIYYVTKCRSCPYETEVLFFCVKTFLCYNKRDVQEDSIKKH